MARQLGRHDLVPPAVRLPVLQSARVRVWVRLSPAHTVPVDGDQALVEQVPGGRDGGEDGGVDDEDGREDGREDDGEDGREDNGDDGDEDGREDDGADGDSALQRPLSTCLLRVRTAGLHKSGQGLSASRATVQVCRWV